jgi:hypothetical protein
VLDTGTFTHLEALCAYSSARNSLIDKIRNCFRLVNAEKTYTNINNNNEFEGGNTNMKVTNFRMKNIAQWHESCIKRRCIREEILPKMCNLKSDNDKCNSCPLVLRHAETTKRNLFHSKAALGHSNLHSAQIFNLFSEESDMAPM